MTYLILGLILFLGVHSVRIVANDWRTRVRQRIGPMAWKGVYSLLSLLGFALIIWGFSVVRQSPTQWWSPPYALRHLAALINLVAFVLLAGAYVPGNRLKARVHHPMALGVMLWAVAHLLANGNQGHVVLFGAFLIWGALSWRAARQRDRLDEVHYPPGSAGATGVTVALGVGAWIVFTLWLHGLLIGVRPVG